MKGVMRVLDHTGDTSYEWDTDVEEEVVCSRELFEDMLTKGRSAFKINPDKSSEKIDKFDPYAGTIVVIAPLVGG